MFKRLGTGLLITLAALGGTAITAAAEEIEVEYDKKSDTTTIQACFEGGITLVPDTEVDTDRVDVFINELTLGDVTVTASGFNDQSGTDLDGTVFGATPGSDKESVQAGKSCEGIQHS